MKKSDFYFDLPERLIAQHPLEQRDASRLMVLDRRDGSVTHRHFRDLLEYVQPGDCMVFNNSRVIPARLMGHAVGHVTPIEVLLLTDKGDGRYTFKMPRSKVTIEASFVEIDHQDTCPAAGFRDVDEDAWYHEAVDYALDNGLMSGVSGREFAPGSTLTRAMVAQMLYSLEGKPAAGRADFADVAEGAWYADAISWAAGEGIVSGYGDTFGPNDPITREQLAAILYRYAQNEGYKTSQSGKGTEGYLDASSISSYAVKAMDWAVNAGLLSGKGNNTLAPTAGATRAEVAQIFMNFCEDIAK